MSGIGHVRKILLVDDHKMTVDGLKLLLSSRTYSLFEAYYIDKAVLIAKEEKPDLAIIDFRIGQQTSDELVREIRYHSTATRVLGYSYTSNELLVLQMIDAGLHGFVQKSTDDEELLTAVDTLIQGKVYFDKLSAGYLMQRLHSAHSESRSITIGDLNFSDKEVAIIKLMSQELSAKEISQRVYLSERTVEQYKSRISKKTGAKNMLGVMKYALKFGLVKLEDL